MTSEQPNDTLSFDAKLPHSWADVAKAVWIKYPNPKIPQVQFEKVIGLEPTAEGCKVTKVKMTHQIFSWLKVYSLTTYDFSFEGQVLNYREEVVKGVTKCFLRPIEVSQYSAEDLQLVHYRKAFFNLGSFIRKKDMFMQKHLEGIEILKELITNKTWLTLTNGL